MFQQFPSTLHLYNCCLCIWNFVCPIEQGIDCTRSIKDSPILVVSNSNVQCKVKTVSLTFAIYCLSLGSELVLCLHLISPCGWGIVLISALSLLSVADLA